MTIDRRGLLSAGAGLGALTVAVAAGARDANAQQKVAIEAGPGSPADHAAAHKNLRAPLKPGEQGDQTKTLQTAIDVAAKRGVAVELPPGRFNVKSVVLREGTVLVGAHGRTILSFAGGASFISGDGANGARIERVVIDGLGVAPELIVLRSSSNIVIHDVVMRGATGNGLGLSLCSGRVSNCDISKVGEAGIFSLDGKGMEISANHVHGCANNAILVWRSKAGEDGTLVSGNRINDISATSGGSGQNGNGINVFRAGCVTVTGNHITDCAYSAVRGNRASNIQIINNSCQRIGEVALYAEFGYQGAVICSNLIDTAACGISVTNFNEGGRLAVIQGNLVRNLFRREHEPIDKRGNGITVEADATVTGNTIEGAMSIGVVIGWGPFMRDVVASSNVIRSCPVGIAISSDNQAGACLVSQNLISGAKNGAIKAMDRGRVHGPELAPGSTQTERVAIVGNLSV